jgi:hypothetical protein
LGRFGSVMRAMPSAISTWFLFASLGSHQMPPYCQISGVSLSN